MKTFAACRAFVGDIKCAALRKGFECFPYLTKAASPDNEALSQGYLSSHVTFKPRGIPKVFLYVLFLDVKKSSLLPCNLHIVKFNFKCTV